MCVILFLYMREQEGGDDFFHYFNASMFCSYLKTIVKIQKSRFCLQWILINIFLFFQQKTRKPFRICLISPSLFCFRESKGSELFHTRHINQQVQILPSSKITAFLSPPQKNMFGTGGKAHQTPVGGRDTSSQKRSPIRTQQQHSCGGQEEGAVIASAWGLTPGQEMGQGYDSDGMG